MLDKLKKRYKKISLFVTLVMVLGLVFAMAATASPWEPLDPALSVNLTTDSSTVEPGGTITLNIHFNNLDDRDLGVRLGWTEFDVDIRYDATKLQPVMVDGSENRVVLDYDPGTWVDVLGFPVQFSEARAQLIWASCIRIGLSSLCQTPVAENIVISMAFDVLDSVVAGDILEFRWEQALGGAAAYNPFSGHIIRLNIAGPFPSDSAFVNVVEPQNVVRFHYNVPGMPEYIEVPVAVMGVPLELPEPLPSRYGSLGEPGWVFMGWHTSASPNLLGGSRSATEFDLNQPLALSMFNNNGVLNLYAIWVQYGDVTGSGSVSSVSRATLQSFLLSMIDENDIILETAIFSQTRDMPTNVDRAMLQSHLLENDVILDPRLNP